MSVHVMGNVWELDLDPAHKLVLLAMADHADHEGGSVHPSVRLIAHKTGYSERQVQRIMRALEAAKILVVESPSTGGRGHTTHYRIVTANGVILSPFKRTEKGDIPAERVTSETKKGDIRALKGDIAMSPEPSEESSRETSDDEARTLVRAFVHAVIGRTPEVVGKKDIATAKELIDLGATPDEMSAIVAWFRSDPFWKDGFTFGHLRSQYVKWRASVGNGQQSAKPSLRPTDHGFYGTTGWADFKAAVARNEIPGVTLEMIGGRA